MVNNKTKTIVIESALALLAIGLTWFGYRKYYQTEQDKIKKAKEEIFKQQTEQDIDAISESISKKIEDQIDLENLPREVPGLNKQNYLENVNLNNITINELKKLREDARESLRTRGGKRRAENKKTKKKRKNKK